METTKRLLKVQERTSVYTTPSAEQQSIDVWKGIGNPGAAGPHRAQTDVTVPNDVVHVPSSNSR